MNTRFEQFLRAENISQSQFADSIGVARASVSHIIAGRNKPGFDFIVSMMKQYPTLNVEWLISGKGKMYKGSMMSESTPYVQTAAPADPATTTTDPIDIEDENIIVEEPVEDVYEEEPQPEIETVVRTAPKTTNKGRRIEKIVIFYDDSTFQEIKG